MARIDIEPGDRFVASSGLFQLRGGQERYVSWDTVDSWGGRVDCLERPVERDTAIAAIRLMGHEVVEVTTGSAPVRITHGIRWSDGSLTICDTKEACEHLARTSSVLGKVIPITF